MGTVETSIAYCVYCGIEYVFISKCSFYKIVLLLIFIVVIIIIVNLM